MSQNTTKLNTTVNDFFNVSTTKPQFQDNLILESQKIEIAQNQKKPQKIAKTPKLIQQQNRSDLSDLPTKLKDPFVNLERKTIFLTEEQIEWYNEAFYNFRKQNKKAKEFQFTVFLFNELAKTKLEL